MKDKIKILLRESLLNSIPLNEYYDRLSIIVEKEIQVGNTLTKKLSGIDNPLAKKMLAFFNSGKIKDDANVDYVDYDKKNEKLLTLGYKDREGNTKEKLVKINKLLSYLGGDTSNIKGYDLENLINHMKQSDTSNMKLVTGEDILKVYHCDNYDDEGEPNEGMGSCMRHEHAQKYLGIYTDNPNQVACLALINPENGKIKGRALIWTLDDGSKSMDRIYTVNSEYDSNFNTYAEEHGISKGKGGEITLENGGEYDYYPYMDTYEFYDVEEGKLSDTIMDVDNLKLQDTSGMGNQAGDYSEVHGESIPEDESVYIEHIEDYVYDHEVVQAWNGDDLLYRDSDDVVKIQKGEYQHGWALKRDAVQDYNNYWVIQEDAYYLEAGEHEGEYAAPDEVVQLYDDRDALRDESVEMTIGDWAGEYALKEDCYVITSGDDEGGIFHFDNKSDFEGLNYIDYSDYEG
jgi:hypothetical protein